MKFVIYVYAITTLFCVVNWISMNRKIRDRTKGRYSLEEAKIIKNKYGQGSVFLERLSALLLCAFPVFNLFMAFVFAMYGDKAVEMTIAKYDSCINEAYETEQNSGKGGS